MKIKQKHLDFNEYTRSGIKLSRLNGIVIHFTDSATGSLWREFYWLYRFLNENRPAAKKHASYHYAIDVEGSTYELIPPDECAWHAGPSGNTASWVEKRLGGKPNWSTLGVSYLHLKPDGKPTDLTRESLVELCADLLNRFNIDYSNIFRHYDCVGKNCPRFYVAHEDEWEALCKDIRTRAAVKAGLVENVGEVEETEDEETVKTEDVAPEKNIHEGFAEVIGKIGRLIKRLIKRWSR